MPTKNTYAFFGRIYPERADVRIPEINLQHTSQFGSFEMHIFAHGSQLLVEVEMEDKIENIHTFKNLVHRGASSLTDTLAFLMGRHVTVEILAVITPSGEKRVFGVVYPYIDEKIKYEDVQEEWLPKITSVYQTEASPYLQRCFTDYRLAMEHAEDTGFYCFRAVETLRQFFNKEDDDSDSWEKLRKSIDIERDIIEENIQIYSEKRRHGDVYTITGDERQLVLETTWKIIKKFIEYADKELSRIDLTDDVSVDN